MVAIYNNNKLVAVSNSKEEAIVALYNKYHKEGLVGSKDPMTWWEHGKRMNCGAPRCHDIEEVAVW